MKGYILQYNGNNPPSLYQTKFKPALGGRLFATKVGDVVALYHHGQVTFLDRLYDQGEIIEAEADALRAYLTAVANWRITVRELITKTQQEDIAIINKLRGAK